MQSNPDHSRFKLQIMLLSAFLAGTLEARLALGVGPDLWAITPSAFYRAPSVPRVFKLPNVRTNHCVRRIMPYSIQYGPYLGAG